MTDRYWREVARPKYLLEKYQAALNVLCDKIVSNDGLGYYESKQHHAELMSEITCTTPDEFLAGGKRLHKGMKHVNAIDRWGQQDIPAIGPKFQAEYDAVYYAAKIVTLLRDEGIGAVIMYKVTHG